jgi:hypothetical protein
MEDLATLEAQLDRLRQSRAAGVRKVTYSDGRSHEFGTLDELRRVEQDLERRIRALQGGPRSSVIYTAYSKGLC